MATIVLNLFGRDRTASDALKKVGRNADDTSRKLDSFGTKILPAVGKRVATLGKTLVGGALQIGAVGSTALTAAPLLLKAASAVGSVVKASLAASPALFGLAAAGGFVALTFKQIGPSIAESMAPVSDAFQDAGQRAGNLAQDGIRPLAGEFARLNMPNISAGMNRIATATNGIVKRFLAWTNSAAGVSAIKNVVDSTAGAFERVSPAVSRFGASLGNMLGRIAGVSTAAGASGLTGVLDKLSAKMDAVNAESVQAGLDKLKNTYYAVRDAVRQTADFISSATTFYRAHRTEIGLLQDALSILAIAFGGPVIAAVAAVGLIIRHWDTLKAAWQGVTAFFTQSSSGTGFMTNLATAAQTIVPALVTAFTTIRNVVAPVLGEIWNKIKNQLIPAFGEFIAAISPVVAFFVGVLGPIVAQVMNNILGVISGVISIITGILKVFTGVLTGNWSKAWEGVKQILSGAMQAIWNLIQLTIFGRIAAVLRGAIGLFGGLLGRAGTAALNAITSRFGAVIGFVRSIPGRISGALGGLGGLLVGAGRALITGLLNGIKQAAAAVYNYVAGIAGKIASLKGPLSYDLRLLVPAGDAIMAGLHAGLLRGVGPVLAMVSGLGARIAGGMSGAGRAAQEILGHLRRGGTVFEDLSFRGSSGAVGTHNDQILQAFRDSGGRTREDLMRWLPQYIQAQRQPAQVIEIRSGGARLDELLVELLRSAIRAQGGNVQLVLGKGRG